MSGAAGAGGLQVLVAGGGPAGALAGILLGQGGCNVHVYEARSATEATSPAGLARSYNNVLLPRGLRALRAARIDLHAPEYSHLSVLIEGSVQHGEDGPVTGPSMVRGSISIDRGGLAQLLLDKASALPNVKVSYEHTLQGVDLDRSLATFSGKGGESVSQGFDLLIGADGVNSAVRACMQQQVRGFEVRVYEDLNNYKTLNLGPMSKVYGYSPDLHWERRMHSWRSRTRRGVVFLSAPRISGNAEGSLICPSRGAHTLARDTATPENAAKFLEDSLPQLRRGRSDAEWRDIAEALAAKRVSVGRTLYCSRLTQGRVVLVGDAAHAMSASLGQGVNSALEDISVLAQELGLGADGAMPVQAADVPEALQRYNKRRLPDVHAICRLSQYGFGKTKLQQTITSAQMACTVLLSRLKLGAPPAITHVTRGDLSYSAIAARRRRQNLVANTLLLSPLLALAAGLLSSSALPPLTLCAVAAAVGMLAWAQGVLSGPRPKAV